MKLYSQHITLCNVVEHVLFDWCYWNTNNCQIEKQYISKITKLLLLDAFSILPSTWKKRLRLYILDSKRPSWPWSYGNWIYNYLKRWCKRTFKENFHVQTLYLCTLSCKYMKSFSMCHSIHMCETYYIGNFITSLFI
jgi:hypothetical protein